MTNCVVNQHQHKILQNHNIFSNPLVTLIINKLIFIHFMVHLRFHFNSQHSWDQKPSYIFLFSSTKTTIASKSTFRLIKKFIQLLFWLIPVWSIPPQTNHKTVTLTINKQHIYDFKKIFTFCLFYIVVVE